MESRGLRPIDDLEAAQAMDHRFAVPQSCFDLVGGGGQPVIVGKEALGLFADGVADTLVYVAAGLEEAPDVGLEQTRPILLVEAGDEFSRQYENKGLIIRRRRLHFQARDGVAEELAEVDFDALPRNLFAGRAV